jgi:hypothetical protein
VIDILTSLFNGVLLNPVEAAGVLVAWALMVVVGMVARRLHSRPGWRFEWLVWTYVCTSIALSVALDGARLAEHYAPNPTLLATAWSFGTSLFFALLAALIWPLFWAASVVSASGNVGTALYLVAVVVVSLIVGAMVAYVITIAVRGLPGGATKPSSEADRA